MRRVIRWTATALVAVFIMPIISLNVETLAQQQHWDAFLANWWGPVMSRLASIATTRWFLGAFAFFLGATIALWLENWMRRKPETKPVNAPHPTRFSGKEPAPLERIPPRIINSIDRQTENLDRWLQCGEWFAAKRFEAADPYLDVKFKFYNVSVFDVTFVGIRGRLCYDEHPLRDEPQVVTQSLEIKCGKEREVHLRQYINAELRDKLSGARGQEFTTMGLELRFRFLDKQDKPSEAVWRVPANIIRIRD